jgi:hypothetical protein
LASEASSATGSGLGAVGALYEGQAQSSSLDRAALIQRQNAALDLQSGQANADRMMISANQKIGAATTGYAASGVTADSGSALAVLAASHANAELDKQNILHGAIVRATNYNNQASMDEAGAKSALQGSYMNAVSSLMMGGSKVFGASAGSTDQYQGMKNSGDSSDMGDDVEEGATGEDAAAGETAEEGGAAAGGAEEALAFV